MLVPCTFSMVRTEIVGATLGASMCVEAIQPELCAHSPDYTSTVCKTFSLYSTDEIRDAFIQFGGLTVDWPHKAQSKAYIPPKGTYEGESIYILLVTMVMMPPSSQLPI